MATATIRISHSTRTVLRGLSKQEGRPMQSILEKAIEEYRRKRILEQANTEYAALRQDSQAASTWQEEIAVWEGTLGDGLGPEE